MEKIQTHTREELDNWTEDNFVEPDYVDLLWDFLKKDEFSLDLDSDGILTIKVQLKEV